MIHDTVKKFRSLFMLGFFLANFLSNPAIHATFSGGSLRKVATCVALCSLYAYGGGASSTPTIDPTSLPSSAPTTYEVPEVIQAIDPYNIEVGDDFHLKIVLKQFFKHPNGYPMTLDLVEKGESELPKGMAFNASTAVFSFKPGDSHIKSFTLYLSATDDRGGKAGFPFNVNVRDPLADPGMQLADYFKVAAPFFVLLISVLIVPICTYFLCKKHEKKEKVEGPLNTSTEMELQHSIQISTNPKRLDPYKRFVPHNLQQQNSV